MLIVEVDQKKKNQLSTLNNSIELELCTITLLNNKEGKQKTTGI